MKSIYLLACHPWLIVTFLFFSVLLLLSLLSTFSNYLYFLKSMPIDVYADGLSQANMVRSQDKNNEAALFFGTFPLLLKNGTIDNFILKFELYNIADKSRYPNATYQISIVKNEYSPYIKDGSVFNGTFLTRNGFLTLDITNANKNNSSKIMGKQANIFPLIFRTDNNDLVNLTVPFQLQSGQYHIRTLVKVPNHNPLYFDSIWQVGEIKSVNLPMKLQLNNITAISYYDKVKNFLYVPGNRSFNWEVPFEYNLSRIDEGKVKVHEELIIPNFFLNSLNATTFSITMNNKHFEESLFSVDPYTIKNKTIFHYVPKDNALFEISNNSTQRSNWLMKFDLHLK